MLFEILFSRPWIRFAMVSLSIIAAIAGVMGPFFQKEFIDNLTGRVSPTNIIIHKWFSGSAQSNVPLTLLAFAFICILISLASMQVVNFLGAKEAILLQRKWSQRMYDHILNLRADTLAGRPIGEIVAIYTTDIPGATIFLEQSLPQAFSSVFPLIAAPFLIVFLFKTNITETLLIIAGVITLNFAMAFRQSKFFYNFKKLAAERVGLVNEWIQNIRTLRILGWVPAFEKKIFKVREVETRNRISMLNNGQSMNAFASCITFILNLTVIYSFVRNHPEKITPGSLLALLWIVAVFLNRPFRQMPWLFTFIFDGTSSLRRTAGLFAVLNEEAHVRETQFKKLNEFGISQEKNTAIEIQNLNLKIGERNVLKNISFKITEGEFIAFVGEVGSGKSLLLLSLLAETGASFEKYQLGPNNAQTLNLEQLRQFFTFIPQEGFIMSASLRENIAFDYDCNQNSDPQILNSLAKVDFDFKKERLPEGLNTEIGERGVNLSGGQRQRVSLARVDYHQAPIILLDDCLSAVDFETENKIMNNLLLGAWKSRTRFLVTHRLTVLPKVHRIFFLKEGELIATGTYDDLLKTNREFRDFTASILKDQKSTQELRS